MMHPVAGRDLLAGGVLVVLLCACEPSPRLEPTPRAPSSVAPDKTAPLTSPPAASAARAALEVECRAKRGADDIELTVDWGPGGGVGRGTLKTTAPGKVDARPVRVELYKGVLLVYAPDEKNPAVHLARVDEIDGKKSIQIGDDKAPRLPCE